MQPQVCDELVLEKMLRVDDHVPNTMDECMERITKNYGQINRALFGGSVKGFEWIRTFKVKECSLNGGVLPLEMVMMILDYLDQPELIQAARTCKTIHILMKSDPYLWPQTVKIGTFNQFTKFLTVNQLFLTVDIKSTLANAFYYYDLKFPFLLLAKRTSIEHRFIYSTNGLDEWVLNYDGLSDIMEAMHNNFLRNTSGSTLFSEYYAWKEHVFDIELNNTLLRLLFAIRRCLTEMKTECMEDYTIELKITNLRLALRDLKGYFNKNERLKQLFRSREKEIGEELEMESNEVLPLPIDNTISDVLETEVGQLPMYICLYCGFKLAGFSCESCSQLLALEKKGNSICNSCHKSINRPVCCLKTMQVKKCPWKMSPSISNPLIFCSKCDFNIGGIRCVACTDPNYYSEGDFVKGRCLESESQYWRKKGTYSVVWSCRDGCGTCMRGGVLCADSFTCQQCNNEFSYFTK